MLACKQDRQLRQAREAREAAGKAAGESVHEVRKVRANIGLRLPEDVKRLREMANQTAVCCADCFKPLASGQSVTLVERFVEHIPSRINALGMRTVARDCHALVPICLCCWLVNIAATNANEPIDDRHEVRRCHCESCGRPLRVIAHKWKRRHWRLRDRCCCEACFRKVSNQRANARRRVCHDLVACEACGEMFTPRQSTARTCSNRCRQKLHRERSARVSAYPPPGEGFGVVPTPAKSS